MNKLNLNLSVQEINTILIALSKQPYEEVFTTINSINLQLDSMRQQQARTSNTNQIEREKEVSNVDM